MRERVVLAFSGGLKSSVALAGLLDQQAEVVAVVLDLGQGGELADVRDRALGAGAVRCHVLDVREEFVRDFVLRVLTAGAFARQPASVAARLTRPLVAKTLVEIARMENSTVLAHGASGADAAALASCLRALDARLKVVAVPTPAPAAGSWQVDTTLWGRVLQSAGPVAGDEDPLDDLFMLTKAATEAPDQPARVELAFEQGKPVAVNGVAMSFGELIESLSTIAGAHAVGRTDRHDTNAGGVRARAIHETPAAHVLHLAHEALEAFVSPPELARFKPMIANQYADLIEQGLWFSPLREACDAFVRKVQERVTGSVRLTLFKGDAAVEGCAPERRQSIEDTDTVGAGR